MAINDAARKWTDAELEALERRIQREYEQAAREMRGKQEQWLKDFEREREQREKALDTTEEAMEAHRRWLQSQAARGDWLRRMADQLAESAHAANEKVNGLINDFIPHVFAENANRAAFAIDKALGVDTGFTLVSEDVVRKVMEAGVFDTQLIKEVVADAPEFGPSAIQSLRKRELSYPRDMSWNRQKFTSAITQGILQGESIPNIVKRTESIYGRNRDAAVRAARTATTNVENAGRMNSFERAQALGIDMEIEWQATLDERTRESHRLLDGERIQLGEYFETENGPIRWPGDPLADPAETWNCRCRADGRVVGFDGERGDWADEEPGERWSRLPQGMTYGQWKAARPVSRSESYENEVGRVAGSWMAQRASDAVSAAYGNGFAGVAEGQNILGTWQRRADDYDFEIEDVMAAQGFDGKPRIVNADEFDRAVREANGGNGFIAQRTYSAPDRETLDAYRDMLYDGKWYVDCSTGGAQYGQGMYCAADYLGKLTDGIKSEMEHYAELGQQRQGGGKYTSLLPARRKEVAEEIVSRYYPNADETLRDVLRQSADSSLGVFTDMTKSEILESLRSYGFKDDKNYWNMVEELHNYSENRAVSYVETMTLDPSAKVITYKDAMKLQDKLWEPGMPGDIGSFTAALGYDAINAAGHGQSGSYTVILNRTKLIIKEP